MKRLSFVSLCLLFGNAVAGPYEDGLAAAISKDYASAYRLWLPLAQMGAKQNPTKENNYQKAIEAASKQDYLAALFLLQSLAEKGSIASDPTNNQGLPPQQDDPKTAKAYQDGMAAALKKDYTNAIKLWGPLAQAGHALSQYALGVMYRDGYGVLKDDIRALMWFSVSVAQLNASANEINTLSKRLSPQQIGEAKKLATDCQARKFNACE